MNRSDGGCDDVEFARIGLGDSSGAAPKVAGSGTVSRASRGSAAAGTTQRLVSKQPLNDHGHEEAPLIFRSEGRCSECFVVVGFSRISPTHTAYRHRDQLFLRVSHAFLSLFPCLPPNAYSRLRTRRPEARG